MKVRTQVPQAKSCVHNLFVQMIKGNLKYNESTGIFISTHSELGLESPENKVSVRGGTK